MYTAVNSCRSMGKTAISNPCSDRSLLKLLCGNNVNNSESVSQQCFIRNAREFQVNHISDAMLSERAGALKNLFAPRQWYQQCITRLWNFRICSATGRSSTHPSVNIQRNEWPKNREILPQGLLFCAAEPFPVSMPPPPPKVPE